MTRITEAAAAVHAALEPFVPEERVRIVRSALLLLGDELPANTEGRTGLFHPGAASDGDSSNLPAPAIKWMKQHEVTVDVLERCFHLEDGQFSVIASPEKGRSKQQQSRVAYLMQGLANHLATGNSTFADEAARALCEKFGCYDKNNHNKIFSSFRNLITGSKSTGWKLTIPGIKHITAAIKANPED